MKITLDYPPSAKARPWTSEEDDLLRALYLSHHRAEIACVLGRTKASIRKRCSVLGLNYKHPSVTDEDRAVIRAWYENRATVPVEDFGLDELAASLGRTKQFISRLAGQMGLTTYHRKVGPKLRAVYGANAKHKIERDGHPRGMLGKKHTEQFRQAQSIRVRNYVYAPGQREKMIDKQIATKMARYGTGNPGMLQSSNPYSRTKGGKRADLGDRFFRSSWEANYARYLNWLIEQGEIKAWDFECHTFVFHGVTRGVLTYTPDFKVYNNDGSYEWHEVKGWMDAKSKAKLKRMAKFYPNETIVVIGAKEYSAIAKWKGLISTWE